MRSICRMSTHITNRLIIAMISCALFVMACHAGVETATERLVSAVRAEDVNKAASALADGANANAEITGVPILIIAAAETCNPEILSLLLNNGADINARDRSTGSTALIISIALNRVNCVERLLAGGARLSEKDNMGNSPLYTAVASGNSAIVDLILKRGGTNYVNLPDNRDITPLMVAAVSGSMPIVKMLIDSSANLAAKDRNGLTAEMHARRKGHEDIARFLNNVNNALNAE